jgi:hypothetical protein
VVPNTVTRDVVHLAAQLVMITCFVILSVLALWSPGYEPYWLRYVAGLGLLSLLVRAGAMLWQPCIQYLGTRCVRRAPPGP